MELKEKKYINNTKELPSYAGGKLAAWLGETPKGGYATRGEMLGNAFPAALGFVGSLPSAFNYQDTSDDMLMDAGQTNASIGGIGYRKYNSLDYTGIHAEEHGQNVANTLNLAGSGAATGAAAGSLLGPIGTGVGALLGGAVGTIAGLFGGGSRHAQMRREQRTAESKADIGTAVNRSNAYTTYLQHDYLKNHGDSRAQTLYGAKDGKLPRKIATGYGPMDVKQNAWVSNGEGIVEPDGSMYVVPGKPNKKDTIPAHLNDQSMVLSKDEMEYLKRTGDMQGAISRLTNKLGGYNCGKLPKHSAGWVPNAVSGGLGMLAGISQYIDGMNQRVKQPNTYVANPYEREAINDLQGLRLNTYPILPNIYDAQNRTLSSINRSGGLSKGQRFLGSLSAMNNTQQNISNLLSSAQQQNNAYISNAASTKLNAGATAAQLMQQANQHDLDYYSKAHAARESYKQMGMRNFLQSLQQYYANEFDRRRFGETMSLYRDKQRIEQEQLDAMKEYLRNINGGGTESTSSPIQSNSGVGRNFSDWYESFDDQNILSELNQKEPKPFINQIVRGIGKNKDSYMFDGSRWWRIKRR